jgi:hypothetical protein
MTTSPRLMPIRIAARISSSRLALWSMFAAYKTSAAHTVSEARENSATSASPRTSRLVPLYEEQVPGNRLNASRIRSCANDSCVCTSAVEPTTSACTMTTSFRDGVSSIGDVALVLFAVPYRRRLSGEAFAGEQPPSSAANQRRRTLKLTGAVRPLMTTDTETTTHQGQPSRIVCACSQSARSGDLFASTALTNSANAITRASAID